MGLLRSVFSLVAAQVGTGVILGVFGAMAIAPLSDDVVLAGRLAIVTRVRLFDHLASMPAVLGNPKVIAGVGVTHLRYPVRKASPMHGVDRSPTCRRVSQSPD